jgi:hypothetical protein
MTFLADECIDQQIVDRLRRDGHETRFVAEMDPGISDEAVLSLSVDTGSICLPRTKISGNSSSGRGGFTQESFP